MVTRLYYWACQPARLVSAPASLRRAGSPLRWFALLLSTCIVLAALIHGRHLLWGGNFHTVLPGEVYRSAQPSKLQLEDWIRRYRIRTIINLRGDNVEPWYYEEHDTGRALGVKVVDVGLWAKHAPLAEEFRLLVTTLAEAPRPILVHCNSGGDRSGLAAAVAVLLSRDYDITCARRQLSVYFGHNPFGLAACHDRLLDRYEEWLAQRGVEHHPEHLREWARAAYVREACE
jgi:protein tyrosine phosphatase (PTP) superfamily phosphohydrolase (DUF442 family)